MFLSVQFSRSFFRFLAVLLLAVLPLRAQAETDSYYAPPSQTHAGLLLSYSDTFSQDYINLNPNPLARFSSATAGFHYDGTSKTISHLRASIATGSVISADKDFTWILISPSALSINQFEEIVLFSTEPAVFDKDNKAVINGFMTLRGITAPAKIEAKLAFVEDKNFISDKVFGDKGSVGLALNVSFRCAEFSMAPVDNNNKSRGDLGILKFEMRAIKQ